MYITHTYPIRIHNSINKFFIYTKHACNYICDSEYYDEKLERTMCPNKKKLVLDYINLSDYDSARPTGMNGLIEKPDQICIEDLEYTVHLEAPLSNVAKIPIRKTTYTSLRELIYIIKYSYSRVYEEELNTATEQTYNLIRECECAPRNTENYILKASTIPTEPCSICYQPFNTKNTYFIQCRHYFHKNCLVEWIDKGSGKTCPMCRTPIKYCDTCNGNELVEYSYTCKVIPQELRRENIYRNPTDGVYGISDYDFDKLFLKYIIYNKLQKTVYVSIAASPTYSMRINDLLFE
jgi:hypothetical protein